MHIDPSQHEILTAIAQKLDSVNDPNCCVAASILRGFLALTLAEQIRITLIGNGVSIQMAAAISIDIDIPGSTRELATKAVCPN